MSKFEVVLNTTCGHYDKDTTVPIPTTSSQTQVINTREEAEEYMRIEIDRLACWKCGEKTIKVVEIREKT